MDLKINLMRGTILLVLLSLVNCQADEGENEKVDQDKNKGNAIKVLLKEMNQYTNQFAMDYFRELIGDQIHETLSFKFRIPKRQQQCFYKEADVGSKLTLNSETLSAPTFTSKGLVSYFATLPDGSFIRAADDEREVNIEIPVNKSGVYAFCMDNSKEYTEKLVQVDMHCYEHGNVPMIHLENHIKNDSIYHIYNTMFHITKGMIQVRFHVLHSRSQAKYHAAVLLSNLSMVNWFSAFSSVLILAVGVLQIYIVKRMFNDPKPIRQSQPQQAYNGYSNSLMM